MNFGKKVLMGQESPKMAQNWGFEGLWPKSNPFICTFFLNVKALIAILLSVKTL